MLDRPDSSAPIENDAAAPRNSVASLYRRVDEFIIKYPRGKVARGSLMIAMELRTLLTKKDAWRHLDTYEGRLFCLEQNVSHGMNRQENYMEIDMKPGDAVMWKQTGEQGIYRGPVVIGDHERLEYARVAFTGKNGSVETLLPTTGLIKVVTPEQV